MSALTRGRSTRGLAGVVAAILIVALGLRILVTIVTWDYTPRLDPADYQLHAVSIVEGNGYPRASRQTASAGGPTAFRPPLYPYFLAAVYMVTGPRWNAARTVQALVGTLSVALIGLLGLQLFGRRVALFSMGLAAVYPPLIIGGAALISEPLFVPLELGALAAAIQHRRSGYRFRWALLAGVMAGLAILTRSNGVVLLLPLVLAVWTVRPRFSRVALAQPGALLAAAVVVVAPWTVRNVIVMDAFVPVSTQGGFGLAGTYNPSSASTDDYRGAWIPPIAVPRDMDLFRPGAGLDEVKTERELRARAFAYARDHPFYVFEAGFWNTVRMLELTGLSWGERVEADVGIGAGLADASVVAFWLVGPLALIGAFTVAARRAPGFFWLTPLLLVASIVFVSGTTRYRTPVEPFVILLASLALDTLWTRLRDLASGPASALVA